MEVKLVVVAGEAPAAEYPVQLPATIGRSRMADVKVGHPLISRKHCELFATEDGMLMIRDLGSLNGTFVGEARIGQPTPLPPGAVITVGAVTFQAVYGEMPPVDASEYEAPPSHVSDAAAASSMEQTLEVGEAEPPITESAPPGERDAGFDFNWLEDPAENAEDAESSPSEESTSDESRADSAAKPPTASDTDPVEMPFPGQEELADTTPGGASSEFAPPDQPDESAEEPDDDDLSDFLASLK
jgi:hypothetical protein